MKKVYSFIFASLFLVSSAFGGIVREGYKFGAKPAGQAVSVIGSKGYSGVVKPTSKVASFPFRHPKKTSHGIVKASVKGGRVAGKVLY